MVYKISTKLPFSNLILEHKCYVLESTEYFHNWQAQRRHLCITLQRTNLFIRFLGGKKHYYQSFSHLFLVTWFQSSITFRTKKKFSICIVYTVICSYEIQIIFRDLDLMHILKHACLIFLSNRILIQQVKGFVLCM